LAALYDAQGKYAEAEPLYHRSLAIYEKALGPSHPIVATTLENLAVLLTKTNRAAEAQALTARANEIRAKHAQQNP
jgi:tetratricopeptide (TPR) repeat protein